MLARTWGAKQSLEGSSQSTAKPCSTNVTPKFVFGLATGVVSGNCLYLNDHAIVYPAAGVIVVYDLEAHSQRLVQLDQPRRLITAMDLNLINDMLAVATVAENNDDEDVNEAEDYEKPIVSIYDLKSLSLKYVFVEPNEEWQQWGPRRFTKVQFLYDNINMVALVVGGGGTDCALYFYGWRNSTVETYVRVDGFVLDVALNPIDLSICCFVGKELFQFKTKTEIDWTQYGFREADGIDFTCVCWLCSDRCVAGTSDGRVIIFKNGVQQSIYYVDEIHDIDVKTMFENFDFIMPTEVETDSKGVRSCIAFESGLVILAGESNIYHFQKIDRGERYVRNNVYVTHNYRHLKTLEVEGELPLHYVESVLISPNGKTLTCITRNGQLHSSPLHQRKEDLRLEEDDDLFNSIIEIRPLCEEMHYGGVGSLSTSLWRPILMTGGKIDFTVKLWDYVKCTMLLSKHYYNQVLSVSIHPTALYSVVAFTDHVEFQIIRIDDLVPLKHFPIRGCNVTVFSGSGHMFALAKPNGEIEIHSTLKFEKCFSCNSHLSTISTLVWSNFDKSIIAYDTAGALCAFHPVDGHVLMHTVPYSDVTFTDLGVMENNRQMFVIAEDGILREFNDDKVAREINLYQGPLNALSISNSNSVLFIATQNGVILTMMLPIMITITYDVFKLHNHGITKMCLAMDGSVLISCSEDGSMCLWEVEDVVNKKHNIDDRFEYSDDLLVKSSDFEKLNKDVIDIRTSVDELVADSKYHINELKHFKEQELNNLQKTNIEELDETRRENNVENQIRSNVISKLVNEVNALKAANTLNLGILDTKYARKLMHKYSKFSVLENKTIELNSKRKKSIDELKMRLSNELQETITNYAKKLKSKEADILKSREKIIYKKNNLRVLVSETENDVDKRVLDKKNMFIAKLNKMKELSQKTKHELSVTKIKYNSYLESNAELKRSTDKAEEDLIQLENSISKMTRKMYILKRLLKNEIQAVPMKDIEIKEVYQKASELEKEIDVRNEIIADLVKDSNSLASEIQNTKYLIEQAEHKYNKAIKLKNVMKLKITNIEQTKKDVEHEYVIYKNRIHNTDKIINQIEVDLRLASQHYNNKNDSETALTKLFNKYTGEMVLGTIIEDDKEAREELLRHITVLGGSITKLEKDVQSSNKKTELSYLMVEKNMKLLKTISDLRNDSLKYVTQYNNLKRILEKMPLLNKEKSVSTM